AFFAGLNADRDARDLPRVGWSHSLSALAEERARALACDGRLVHAPPAALAQVRDDQGRPLSWFGENVARGHSADDVRAAFLRSPSHRRNHLAADASSAGIGAAWRCRGGRCTLFLVEILARSYAETDAAGLIDGLLQRLNRRRLALGAPALELDPGLAAAAQQRAQRMADRNELIGDAPDEPALTQQLMDSRRDLLAAGAAVFRADSPSGIELQPVLLRAGYNVVGVGAARSEPRQPWYVAVIVAEDGDPGQDDDAGPPP
ncbi:MAG: hypothetical protein JXR83_04200, partial [Deltaproteobacteria bacterium]|nr:hypothetical protein [Deltaproteobacteria bacterium]